LVELVVQQWTLLLVNQKLQENPDSYAYRSYVIEGIGFAALFASEKTVVATVGRNYCLSLE
jgi:hypothetical protein